jgi:signal transduction histidine kinase
MFSTPCGHVDPDAVTGRDNVRMVQVANWSVRGVVFLLVGLFSFLAPWPGRAQFTVQVTAYVVSAFLMVVVVSPDRTRPTRERYPRLLPYALGCIVVLSTLASMTRYGGSFILISVSAMVSAGSSTGLGVGWLLSALGTLVLIPGGIAVRAPGLVIFEYPVLLLLGLFLGHSMRAHRVQAEQAVSLLAQAERLREEQALVATLDERSRIAREIHDVLAHSLGALAVQIQVAGAVLTDQRDVDRAVELLDQARRMANDGLDETRRAVHALRGETLPLAEGLARLGANHQSQHGAAVSFEVSGEPRTLTPDAGLAIARTAQEALVNTAKHAPRQPVGIRLDYTPADTSLVVTNRLGEDERAGRPDQRTELATVDGGYGLAGMRERLLLLKGTLSAGRTGNEWIVVARVPQ